MRKTFAIAVLLLLLLPTVSAKSYHMKEISVAVRVNSDSSFDVVENLTYSFDQGDFTFAYREIPLTTARGNTISIIGIRVDEGGQVLVDRTVEAIDSVFGLRQFP